MPGCHSSQRLGLVLDRRDAGGGWQSVVPSAPLVAVAAPLAVAVVVASDPGYPIGHLTARAAVGAVAPGFGFPARCRGFRSVAGEFDRAGFGWLARRAIARPKFAANLQFVGPIGVLAALPGSIPGSAVARFGLGAAQP